MFFCLIFMIFNLCSSDSFLEEYKENIKRRPYSNIFELKSLFPLVYFPVNWTIVAGYSFLGKKIFDKFKLENNTIIQKMGSVFELPILKNIKNFYNKKRVFKSSVLDTSFKISLTYLLYNSVKWIGGRHFHQRKDIQESLKLIEQNQNKIINVTQMINNYSVSDIIGINAHGTKPLFYGIGNAFWSYLRPNLFDQTVEFKFEKTGETSFSKSLHIPFYSFEWPSENLSYAQQQKAGGVLLENLINVYKNEYVVDKTKKKIIIAGNSHGGNVVIECLYQLMISGDQYLTENEKVNFFKNIIIGLDATPLSSQMIKKIIKIMEEYETTLVQVNSPFDSWVKQEPFLSYHPLDPGNPIHHFRARSNNELFNTIIDKKIKGDFYNVLFHTNDIRDEHHCEIARATFYLGYFILNNLINDKIIKTSNEKVNRFIIHTA